MGKFGGVLGKNRLGAFALGAIQSSVSTPTGPNPYRPAKFKSDSAFSYDQEPAATTPSLAVHQIEGPNLPTRVVECR